MSTLFARPFLFVGLCLTALFVGAPSLAHAQATFTVTSTADAGDFDTSDGVCDTDDSAGDGPCTFRAAIEQANATANVDASTPDRIEFDLSGTAPHVIAPTSNNPLVQEAVVIDGTTQPGYSGTPVVVLDGGPGNVDNGLVVTGRGSTIRALSVVGFNAYGVNLTGGVVRTGSGGHVVEGSYLGLRPDGTADGNGDGLFIYRSQDNRIGGPSAADRNLISGNAGKGIAGSGRGIGNTIIQNNWIGLGPDGATAVGNGTDGVVMSGRTSGLQVLDNVIADNGRDGLLISSITDAVVQGNYIGTTADGNTARGNGTGLTCNTCVGLQVGGPGPGEGNVIADNGYGVRLDGNDPLVTGVVIEGNRIGVAADGTTALGNRGSGIQLVGGFDAPRIGGADPAARNLVSNNGTGIRNGAGIYLEANSQKGGGAENALLQNNYVGLDASGTRNQGNQREGILVDRAPNVEIRDNVVSGTTGASGSDGIEISVSDGAVIQGNRIGTRADGTGQFGNEGNGILCSRSSNVTVGGPGSGEGNRVVGSGRDGIRFSCTSSTIVGNVIGRDANDTPAGNGRHGIYLGSNATDVVVGGTTAGAPNVIAHSGRSGVVLEKAQTCCGAEWADRIALRRNVILESGAPPIDLDNSTAEDFSGELTDGRSLNDDGDADTNASGANNMLNYPEIGIYTYDDAQNQLTVDFRIETAPVNAAFPIVVEFFRSGARGDAEAFLGEVSVQSSDAQTLLTQTFQPQEPLQRQDFLVATATDADGRTSELTFLRGVVSVDGETASDYPFIFLGTQINAIGQETATGSATMIHELWTPVGGPPSGTDLAIAGFWTVDVSNGVQLREVCFPLNDLLNAPADVDEQALVVYRRQSASDAWGGLVTSITSNYVCGASDVDGYEYIVAADPSALPVELSGFDARRDAETVRLAWQTASETNNAGFHVERRATNGSWTDLGFVDGHGTTEAAQRYRFTDTRLPFAADSLSYRLRQVDLDGTAALSDEIVVRIGGPDRLELFAPYPNPAFGAATLRYALPTATEARIEVYNVLGQRVAMLDSGPQAAGRVEQTLDTSRLPSGMYFIRLRADGQVQTQRFTVVQ